MNSKLVGIIFFIVAIIDVLVAMMNFNGGKTMMGITYLVLAAAFIMLGVRYRKKQQ